jgi:hypothetical protein
VVVNVCVVVVPSVTQVVVPVDVIVMLPLVDELRAVLEVVVTGVYVALLEDTEVDVDVVDAV